MLLVSAEVIHRTVYRDFDSECEPSIAPTTFGRSVRFVNVSMAEFTSGNVMHSLRSS